MMNQNASSQQSFEEVSQRDLLDALLVDTSVSLTGLSFGGSLPYAALGGYGLERLCYRILVADGLMPRFFGKVGQPQYGIDLLTRDGESYSVYQCKNVQHLDAKDMRSILEVFEREWLGRPHLPRPRSFALICPLDFRDVRQSTDWLSAEHDFTARTDILLDLWDRNILDERLRTLPSIVADLFSHRIAEHFCNIDDWHADLFGDLASGTTSPVLSRFRYLRDAGHLVVTEDLQELFNGTIDAIGAVLLRGPGGGGKSITGLALADGLESPHRIYHIDLRYDCSEREILQGIRRRSSQPCVFILDNCEHKSGVALRINERIRRWQVGHDMVPKLVCAYRSYAHGGEHVTTELEDHFARLGAVLDIKPTHEFIRSVLELRKPQFAGLSAARMDRLASLTAGDLVILDWLVTEIAQPADLDSMGIADVVERVSKRYPRMRPPVARCVQRVAALQQFDIAPEALTFPCDPLIAESEANFVSVCGRPPRYFAPHSSAAELMFQSLCWAHAEPTQPTAAGYLVDYFRSLESTPDVFGTSLVTLLENRLRLVPETEEIAIKADVLSNSDIHRAIANHAATMPLPALGLALVVLHAGNKPALDSYVDLVTIRLASEPLVSRARGGQAAELHRFLGITRHRFPALLHQLEEQVLRKGLTEIVATADLVSVAATLAELVDGRAEWLEVLGAMGDNEAEALLDAAVASRQSLGSYSKSLGRLRIQNERFCQAFETAIGPERLVRLLLARGTLSSFFHVVENSTVALPLIDRLDAHLLRVLCDRTIEDDISLGAIPNLIRRLAIRDVNAAELLHRRITPRGYAMLVRAAGTITDLIGLCAILPADIVRELVNEIDVDDVDALVNRTLARRKSIGTIGVRFRQLRATHSDVADSLEHLLSADRYFRLIVEAGTVNELFRVVDSASAGMIRGVLAALEPEAAARIVARTLAADRPIGTLHFRLRQLRDSTPELLTELERALGSAGYLLLLREQGTLGDLLKILATSSLGMAREIVNSVGPSDLDRICARTASRQRGFGSIALALKELRAADSELSLSVEAKISTERYIGLLKAIGTLPNLTTVLGVSSAPFGKGILEQLDETTVGEICSTTIAQRVSISAIPLNLWNLRTTSEELLTLLEVKVGTPSWIQLLRTLGSLVDLLSMLQQMSPCGARALIDAVDDSLVDVLCRRTLTGDQSVLGLPLWLRGVGARSRDNLVTLQDTIGAKRLAQVVMTLGDIQVLAGSMQQVEGGFGSQLWAEVEARADQMPGVLQRSSFVAIGRLARWKPRFLHKLGAPDLATAIADCVSRASWEDLSAGVNEFEQASRSFLTGSALGAAKDRVAGEGLAEFREASFASSAARLGLMWRLVPDQRFTWVSRFLEFMPDRRDWPNDPAFLKSWCEVLRIASDPDVADEDLARVLELGKHPKVIQILRRALGGEFFYVCWRVLVVATTKNTGVSLQNSITSTVIGDWLATVEEGFLSTNSSHTRDLWLAVIGLFHSAGALPVKWQSRKIKAAVESMTAVVGRVMEHRPEVAAFLCLGWERVTNRPMDKGSWQRIALTLMTMRGQDADYITLASIFRKRAK